MASYDVTAANPGPGPGRTTTFHHPRIGAPRRRALFDAAHQRFPGAIASSEDAGIYLGAICAPQNRRWVFCSNGKSGTSSAKRFLFELSFGSKLSVNFVSQSDINPDAVSDHLIAADVFRPLSFMHDALEVFDTALRLATVRAPESRAVSAFLYICKSNEMGYPWFLRDRLHMNALVGFDWETDAKTAAGFEKFLRYIELDIRRRGPVAVDAHWRPQHATIRPEIFRPGLIGKTEALPAFFRQIAERLGHRLPGDWEVPATNRSSGGTASEALLTPAARKLIETIYARDFEEFDYHPGQYQ